MDNGRDVVAGKDRGRGPLLFFLQPTQKGGGEVGRIHGWVTLRGFRPLVDNKMFGPGADLFEQCSNDVLSMIANN